MRMLDRIHKHKQVGVRYDVTFRSLSKFLVANLRSFYDSGELSSVKVFNQLMIIVISIDDVKKVSFYYEDFLSYADVKMVIYRYNTAVDSIHYRIGSVDEYALLLGRVVDQIRVNSDSVL